ncbi:MAG: O-antigen ligase family protein [Oscillospiraceae bacterium]|nr:O-antigen ligase family protein [Oscillospiraceae bacterium]
MALHNIWRGSIVWRILAAVALCWQESGLRRRLRAVAACWMDADTKARLCRALDAQPEMTRHSVLYRGCLHWNRALAGVHAPLILWRESLLCRIYGALLRVGRGSRVLGWLFDGGMTTLVLFLAAMYLPIDYLLRDIIHVPVVSSLWDEALLVFALFWILRTRMDRPKPVRPRTSPLDLPVLLFLGIGFALMLGNSPYFSVAVSGYRATAQYILWFFVALKLIRDDRDFTIIYLAMAAIAFLISLHGIYQYIVAVPIPSNWTDQAETSVRTRVFSIFGSPNIMGDFMVMFAPMTAALAYYFEDRKAKVFCWFATLCMCFSCLFTMSRGAWVAMALAILIFAILQDRRLFLLILLAGVCSLFLPFVASRIGYLFTDEFANSTANGGRSSRWNIALAYLRMNPVFGFGLGMFGGAVAMQTKVYQWVSYFYVDNYYLKILVEMGYTGFITFVVMMLSVLVCGARVVYRLRGDRIRPLAVGVFAGLCGVLAHCYFENIFEEPYMMVYFWIMAALLMYLGFFRHRKKQ